MHLLKCLGTPRLFVLARASRLPWLAWKHPRQSLSLTRSTHSQTQAPLPKASQSHSPDVEYDHFFRYTSGRWLWNEDEQMRARYRQFNVEAALSATTSACGASRCTGIEKIGEGGFNKVFRITFEDKPNAILRIPTLGSGDAFYTTCSEVATMDFVSRSVPPKALSSITDSTEASSILKLPVPRVIAYDADPNNPVGAEYILMEEAVGEPLHEKWDSSSGTFQMSIMRQMVDIEAVFTAITFKAYGSLYLAEQNVPNARPAVLTEDSSSALRAQVSSRYCIGPAANQEFWCAGRSSLDIDRGPWSTALDCLRAKPLREISFAASRPDRSASSPRVPSQSDPEQHIDLQKRLLGALPGMLNMKADWPAVKLWHTDLFARNLFVQGDQISSIIDWQGASIEPFFLSATPCGLIRYHGPQRSERPDDYDKLEKQQQDRIRNEVLRTVLQQLYLGEVEKSNTKLYEAFLIEFSKTRLDVIKFGKHGIDDDIIAFREAHFNVQRQWSEMVDDGTPCPFKFTQDDLTAHLKEGEGWNERADFFERVQDVLQDDGYTSNETYEEARKLWDEVKKLAEGE